MDELHYAVGDRGFPLELHLSMVTDRPRVRAFQRALKELVRPGDVVVDVGSGTGILSFLAWRCGAGRVIGLERSDIVETAREAKERNLPDAAIEFHQVDALHGELPRVRADVLVCELLGNFGLEEDIVPILRRVRSRMLKPGGRVIPASVDLVVAPAQGEDLHRELSAWGERRHGLDFSPFQALAYDRVYHLKREPWRSLARPAVMSSIDLTKVSRTPRRMTAELVATRTGPLHGFVTWFEARLSPRQTLSIGPRAKGTHWGHVYFPVGEPIAVRRGDALRFDLRTSGEHFAREWIWSGRVTGHGRPARRFRRRSVELL